MRVDSRELPLSAVPPYQLLPCHLGPPRPTLPINLYVKGCLDCTIWAFHMSIQAEPFLLQNEVQILNAKPRKWLIGLGGDSVLRLDIADLSDHCPVIPLQTLEVWHASVWKWSPFIDVLYSSHQVSRQTFKVNLMFFRPLPHFRL